jgi:nickel/cobalt exporter
MTTEFSLLLGTAATLGLVHTLLGPDHYVPFIAMAKARNWSNRRTVITTLLCGIGHVSSSVIIGMVGLLLGVELLKLTALESARGEIAGWLLFGFGIAYMIWGIRRAVKRASSRPHSHGLITHQHVGGALAHSHDGTHDGQVNITPWIIFTIFVFGPCEPLIPLIMLPAVRADVFSAAAVALTFSFFTIGTMLTLVYASVRGLARVNLGFMERYSHALAGFVVAACGAGIQFLGL